MENRNGHVEDLKRIEEALNAAAEVLRRYHRDNLRVDYKTGDDPVTAADHAANEVLRNLLLRPGEGWLSEETVDDLSRRKYGRVWIVDPLDGTREFVAGIPEWCVSVGLLLDGEAVAGGICNPATGELIIGAHGLGVSYNCTPVQVSRRASLAGATILASRSEIKRGKWQEFENQEFTVRPMGSVAYKLGLVAAGLADATWTLTPKHEWDVAAGVALVRAGRGFVRSPDDEPLRFNSESLLFPGLVAGGELLEDQVMTALNGKARAAAKSA